MLTPRHLATMRASLGYWLDEIVPHGLDAAVPYLPPEGLPPLSAEETEALADRLRSGVRYVVYNPGRGCLEGTNLYDDFAEAERAAAGLPLAVVILPVTS